MFAILYCKKYSLLVKGVKDVQRLEMLIIDLSQYSLRICHKICSKPFCNALSRPPQKPRLFIAGFAKLPKAQRV